MADIEEYLRAILNATFGEQVRGSIHDAIEVMNVESEGSRADASAAQRSASVVENAFTVTNGLMDQARTWHDEWEEVVGNINYGIYPMGPATVATLPSEPQVGWMYYMTQADVTDDRFLEGPGVDLLLNQKVYFTNKGKWSIMVADGLSALVKANKEYIDYLKTCEQWVTYTLRADKWEQDTDGTWIYPLYETYPNDEYDILDVLPVYSTSNRMRQEWERAYCGGREETNIIRCRGVVPEIDISIGLYVKRNAF